ncbi:MAG TPA: helix-turn-helix domain-containing protein [Desulfosporosinus sp.]|nr:helix-turn-helix domain-containing protein [Desulfosporosinus sp.]
MPIEQKEKQMIRFALKRYGDSVNGKKQAAKALKISLATLYNKLRTMS